MKRRIIYILVTIISILSLTSCGINFSDPSGKLDVIEQDNTTITQIQTEITKAANEASKSCVGIRVETPKSTSIGSGVIYKIIDNETKKPATAETKDATCFVVTNEHVVVNTYGNKTSYSVYLGNENYIKASVLGTDSVNDLAVITFAADIIHYKIQAIKDFYETTHIPASGSFAFAIGCPLSLDNFNYMTYGMVGNVTLKEITHSVDINPGNSGGGLFDTEGRLIGINVSKMTEVLVGEENGEPEYITVAGIAYAIPIWTVRDVVSDIENVKTNIIRPTLGITVRNVNATLVEEDKELLPNTKKYGVRVEEVNKNSNAERLGLRKGDIFISLDNGKADEIEVIRTTDIEYFLNITKVGATIKVKIYRENQDNIWQEIELEVELK